MLLLDCRTTLRGVYVVPVIHPQQEIQSNSLHVFLNVLNLFAAEIEGPFSLDTSSLYHLI